MRHDFSMTGLLTMLSDRCVCLCLVLAELLAVAWLAAAGVFSGTVF
jgi:hypothetical protein